MKAAKKKHITYFGDWVFHMGPMFCETPFNVAETKDCDLHFYGERLKEALEPKATLDCLANWELYRLSPEKYAEKLKASDCLIVSDVEARCFHLNPDFFDRAKRTGKAFTYPDRLDQLKDFVAKGGGLMMLGGWLSFSGRREDGGWRRSRMADALPVACIPGEDLMESSAGFTAKVELPSHPLAKNLPWQSYEPIFGYNELIAKDKAQVVVSVKETGHPLVVAGEYGKGRILVYASDPAPHWGINFELWKGYDKFWQQGLDWVCGK